MPRETQWSCGRSSLTGATLASLEELRALIDAGSLTAAVTAPTRLAKPPQRSNGSSKDTPEAESSSRSDRIIHGSNDVVDSQVRATSRPATLSAISQRASL